MIEKEEQELYIELKKMMRTQFSITKKVLEDYGLYVGQPQLLFILLKEEGLRQKDIAEKLDVKAATVNVTAKRLEKSGFIEKRNDIINKRISRLYLTDKGRETCMSVKEVMNDINNDLFSVLSDEEKQSFKNIVMKINNNRECI